MASNFTCKCIIITFVTNYILVTVCWFFIFLVTLWLCGTYHICSLQTLSWEWMGGMCYNLPRWCILTAYWRNWFSIVICWFSYFLCLLCDSMLVWEPWSMTQNSQLQFFSLLIIHLWIHSDIQGGVTFSPLSNLRNPRWPPIWPSAFRRFVKAW